MALRDPLFDATLARLMEIDQASVFALADIAAERVRQVEAEGWTPEHDNAHQAGELATAAACYALAAHTHVSAITSPPSRWPWSREWWKPHSRHRNYVRAGALLVAELARHSRSAPAHPATGG